MPITIILPTYWPVVYVVGFVAWFMFLILLSRVASGAAGKLHPFTILWCALTWPALAIVVVPTLLVLLGGLWLGRLARFGDATHPTPPPQTHNPETTRQD